jgi:Subtilase family
MWPRVPLPGSGKGFYGFASGTSFAAPQVAGAAALVWGVKPSLSAAEVASILEQTASGRGAWTPDLGFGVLDIARAVEAAGGWVLTRTRLSLLAHRSARSLALRAVFSGSRSSSAGERSLVLERFRGHTWQVVARAQTNRAGRAAWTISLGPGSHVLRARFAGTPHLAAAASRAVRVRIR